MGQARDRLQVDSPGDHNLAHFCHRKTSIDSAYSKTLTAKAEMKETNKHKCPHRLKPCYAKCYLLRIEVVFMLVKLCWCCCVGLSCVVFTSL